MHLEISIAHLRRRARKMNNAWTKLTVILLGLPSKLFSQFFSRHERFAPEFGTFPMVNRTNISQYPSNSPCGTTASVRSWYLLLGGCTWF